MSACRYNVLGHFKLCSILLGGFLIFKDSLNATQVHRESAPCLPFAITTAPISMFYRAMCSPTPHSLATRARLVSVSLAAANYYTTSLPTQGQGILVALGGIFAYTYFKLQEMAPPPPTLPVVREEEEHK